MQCFLDESLATERTLHAHMARVRTVAQAKRMLLLLDALYGEIQGHVEAASREQEEKLRVLEKTKAADLQDFVDFHKNLVRENLSEALESVLDRTDAKIGKACRSGKQEILASVRRQEDAQSLKRYLENGLMRRFKWEADKAKEIAKNSCRDLAGRLQSELRQFYGAFAEEYRQQGIAELDLDMPVLPPIRVETVDTDDFGNALRYAAAQLDKEFGGSVVGGSIGGVLGFVGGGPLGAAAGAWLGNKIGKFLARDAGFQNTCADRLSGELEGCFSRLRQGLVGSVESCGEEIVGQSSEMIDQYHVTYRAEIGKLVRSQQAQIRAAQTRLEGLRRDTAAILERKNRLEDVRTRLDAHSKQGEGHKGTRKERKK